MSASPAYNGSVSITGTSTATTAEATTNTDPGTYKNYQVTDATKRQIDPGVTVTVKKNTVAQSSALYTVNYMFGVVTFTSGLLITDAVTIDFSYLPVAQLADTTDFEWTITRDLLDVTSHKNAVAVSPDKERIYGLADLSGSVLLNNALADDTFGDASRILRDVIDNGTVVVLEIYLTSAQKLRAFVAFDKTSIKGGVAALVAGSIEWKLAGSGSGAANKAFYALGT